MEWVSMLVDDPGLSYLGWNVLILGVLLFYCIIFLSCRDSVFDYWEGKATLYYYYSYCVRQNLIPAILQANVLE